MHLNYIRITFEPKVVQKHFKYKIFVLVNILIQCATQPVLLLQNVDMYNILVYCNYINLENIARRTYLKNIIFKWTYLRILSKKLYCPGLSCMVKAKSFVETLKL